MMTIKNEEKNQNENEKNGTRQTRQWLPDATNWTNKQTSNKASGRHTLPVHLKIHVTYKERVYCTHRVEYNRDGKKTNQK